MPLSKKAQENIESAKFLIAEDRYSSSVHCAYYSCLQNMLYIIYEKLRISEADFMRRCNEEQGTHATAINIIKSSFKVNRPIEKRDFSNYIGQLKRERINADYKIAIFNKSTSENSLKKAIRINEILESNF